MSDKPCEFCGDSANTHDHWGLSECVDLDACLRRQAEQGDMVAAALVDERKARKARKELEIEPTDFHLIYSLGGAVKSEYKSFASPDDAEAWLKSIGARHWTIEYWAGDTREE